MKNAVYMRCSTDHQDNESQRHALKEWIEAEGLADDDLVWLEDAGVRGTAKVRPSWDRCMDMVRAGEVRRIVCFRKDRLGRDMGDRLRTMGELMGHGVEVVSLNEDTDFSTLEGLLMECVRAYIAAVESRTNGERVRAGIARVKGSGGAWDRSREQRRRFDREAAQRMYAEGMNYTQIAQDLGVTRQSVAKAIKPG